MRAADALEKRGPRQGAAPQPHKALLLSGRLADGTPQLRWHLVAIASRLALSDEEAAAFAFRCNQMVRHDRRKILRVMALQALFDVAARHPALWPLLTAAHDLAAAAAAPSLRARGAKLERLKATLRA